MRSLFDSGHAVDIVLAVIAIEAVILVTRGRALVPTLLMLGPAVLILLALRVALTGGDWRVIATLLAASFPVHLADLRARDRTRA
jgi:hypothetical protein